MRRLHNPNAYRGLPTLEQVRATLVDLWSLVSPFYASQSGDYTTSGSVAHEIVVGTSTNATTIKAHASPADGDEITVKQQNTGTITFSGNGKNIDGQASITLTRYDAVHAIYTDDGGEWSII